MCTPSLRRRALIGALLALTTSTPGVLVAHEFPLERGLVVQMSANEVHVLVSYQDPRTDRSSLLFKNYDINADGRLEGKEAQLAAGQLLPMALQGVKLEVPGLKPGTTLPQVKIERTTKGELVMMALVTYTLPAWTTKEPTRQFKVSLDSKKTPPLQVVFKGIEGVQIKDITPRHKRFVVSGQSTLATFVKGVASKASSTR